MAPLEEVPLNADSTKGASVTELPSEVGLFEERAAGGLRVRRVSAALALTLLAMIVAIFVFRNKESMVARLGASPHAATEFLSAVEEPDWNCEAGYEMYGVLGDIRIDLKNYLFGSNDASPDAAMCKKALQAVEDEHGQTYPKTVEAPPNLPQIVSNNKKCIFNMKHFLCVIDKELDLYTGTYEDKAFCNKNLPWDAREERLSGVHGPAALADAADSFWKKCGQFLLPN